MSLFAGELPGQAVVEVRNSCLVATGERNFFAFPAADEQPAGDLRLTLERNVFYSVDTSEAKTAFFFVRGEGEPAVDIELQRNIFAGTQPDGLLDLMMGRRNDKSVYAPDLNVPPDCYLSPDDTFGTIDSKRMGPVPIAEAMP
jgi:hypothetical protein